MSDSDSNEPVPSPFELPPLAQLGAVTGRFVHDLANDISSAATLMTLIAEPDSGNAPAKEDLDELNAALERSVTQIHHFGATVRSLRPPPEPVPYPQIAEQIKSLFTHYGIALTVDPAITDDTEVLCHPTWMLHCLDYAARLYTAPTAQAKISLVPAKSVTPPVDFYSIDKPTHWFEIALSFPAPKEDRSPIENSRENQPLFVTRELLRHMRGFLLQTTTADSLVLSFYWSSPPSAAVD